MTRVIIASAGLNGVSLAHYTGREIAPNTGANVTKFSLWRPNPEN